ncbi:hypothetical protein GCM10023238_20180 [Streptomyces heliomycini]
MAAGSDGARWPPVRSASSASTSRRPASAPRRKTAEPAAQGLGVDRPGTRARGRGGLGDSRRALGQPLGRDRFLVLVPVSVPVPVGDARVLRVGAALGRGARPPRESCRVPGVRPDRAVGSGALRGLIGRPARGAGKGFPVCGRVTGTRTDIVIRTEPVLGPGVRTGRVIGSGALRGLIGRPAGAPEGASPSAVA